MPERNIIFDLNDFDKTLPGSFEWDLKALGDQLAVAADNNGTKKSVGEKYVRSLEEFAYIEPLEIWCHRINL